MVTFLCNPAQSTAITLNYGQWWPGQGILQTADGGNILDTWLNRDWSEGWLDSF